MKTPIPSRNRLDGIQFGRGIAASLVVFYHTGRMLVLPQYVGHGSALAYIFAFGDAGVDFFFTLSGFIIYYVHQADIDRPNRLRHYVWQRITRIYPMYWVVTAILIALAVLKHDWARLAATNLIEALLLLPGLGDPLLGVAWTLQHEVLFYMVFAIVIISRASGIVVGALWLGIVLFGFFGWSDNAFIKFVQHPHHLEFALGILAAAATRKWPIANAFLLALLGMVIFAVAAALVDAHVLIDIQLACRLLYGVASALILYGVSVSELRRNVVFPPWSAYLGAASYSIYLVHTIVIGFMARAVFHFPIAHELPNLVFLSIGLLAIALGCLAYQFVEISLQALIRRFRPSRRAPNVVPADSK